MTIVTYEPKYQEDVVRLVESFYKEYLVKFDDLYNREIVFETVREFEGKNAKNLFLMICNDRAEGIIAGVEVKSKFNQKLCFQEIMFYVSKPFGGYAFQFIKKIKGILKESGFNMLVMAVIESPKAERIKEIYKAMNFTSIESHYITNL